MSYRPSVEVFCVTVTTGGAATAARQIKNKNVAIFTEYKFQTGKTDPMKSPSQPTLPIVVGKAVVHPIRQHEKVVHLTPKSER
jgi:hypothetical protein